MGAILTRPAVTVAGLDDWEATPQIIALRIGHGSGWGDAVIRLPGLRGLDDVPDPAGQVVSIDVGGTRIFQGRIVGDSSMVGGRADDLILTAVDVRWDAAQRTVGEIGTGDLDETDGGFAGVGFRVHFNPRGRGNRTADPLESGIYGFDPTPAAEKWTRKQALQFVAAWYWPDLTIDAEGLSAAWDEVEDNLFLYGLPVNQALTEIARRAGESWVPRYDGSGGVEFQPIGPAYAETFTVSLADADDAATTATAGTTSVLRADVERSIQDSVDQLEIHTAKAWIEHTYSSGGDDPLLAMTDVTDATGEKKWIFQTDTTKYEAHLLGKNLPAGSKPKRWVPTLITRRTVNGLTLGYNYVAAGSVAANNGTGQELRTSDAVWIQFGSGSLLRVKGGIEIDHEKAMVTVESPLELAAGPRRLTAALMATAKLYVTTVTEIEGVYYFQRTRTPQFISGGPRVKAVVVRQDIQPRVRLTSILPDYGTNDPNAWLVAADGVAEHYTDTEGPLEEVANAYWTARGRREHTVRLTLVDIPPVRLGAMLAGLPATAGLDGTEAIVEVRYEMHRAEQVTITATNQFGRVIVGDL